MLGSTISVIYYAHWLGGLWWPLVASGGKVYNMNKYQKYLKHMENMDIYIYICIYIITLVFSYFPMFFNILVFLFGCALSALAHSDLDTTATANDSGWTAKA